VQNSNKHIKKIVRHIGHLPGLFCRLDVRGSVHHSTIHKENPTRCNSVSNFFYSIFIWSSTRFGRL